jgi:transcriptional regulator with XRE-family HTH domain
VQRHLPFGWPKYPQGHGRVAFLPYIRVLLKCKKPKEKFDLPKTIGEHIRQKRISLELHQGQVASIIGVDKGTLFNWENEKSTPAIKHYPAIFRFLGYDPGPPEARTIPALLKAKRRELGLTQRQLAAYLKVDPSTITNWEQSEIVHRLEHRVMLAQFLRVPEDEFRDAMRGRWVSVHQ